MLKMARTILKNLFSRPATRKYPYIKREPFKGARGNISINIDECIYCGACSKQCPTNAITVNREENSWAINRYKCIMCEYCTEKCPKKCLSVEALYAPADYKKEIFKAVKAGSNDNKA